MKRREVLLLGFEGRTDALAGRLLRLNLRAVPAAGIDEALSIVERGAEPIGVGMLPVDHPFGDLRPALDRLREVVLKIEFIVTGRRPPPEALDPFREARVGLGLFEPYEDSELRFVVNEALFDRTRGEVREKIRVPTGLVGRVFSASGERPARIYNISATGAYLETPRPTSTGGHVRIEVPLPAGRISVAARVVSTNVTGNLQRTELPIGMGVEFAELDAEGRKAILEFVAERVDAFRL